MLSVRIIIKKREKKDGKTFNFSIFMFKKKPPAIPFMLEVSKYF